MKIKLEEKELLEAVREYFSMRDIKIKEDSIVLSCEWDQGYDLKPHSFEAWAELK